MDSAARPAGGDSLPRWTLLALVPFVLLAACAIYLGIRWNDIPARFPIHWGAHGPNGWATRTFLGVYRQLIFGAGLAGLLIGVGLMGYYGSGRAKAGETMLRAMVAVGCFLGLIFSGVGLLPLGLPTGVLVAAAPLCGLAMLGLLLATASGEADEPAERPDSAAPPLFVPKTVGWGYTYNFANRYSWVILGTLFVGLAALIAFMLWAGR